MRRCQRMGVHITQKQRNAFAKVLKDWRAAKKLSQSEAARVLEVPLKTLQNWEIARTLPKGYAYTALLKVLTRNSAR